MEKCFAVVIYAREIFDDSDEETNINENVENFAEVVVPRMNDNQFHQHFRMQPETFEDLLNKASNVFRQMNLNVSGIGLPRTIIQKELLITIWYLGNLESFRSVASRFGVSKSTCWSILYRTAKLLLRINDKFKIIHWPNYQKQTMISRAFTKSGFTGVIGCIDGCHIKINGPKHHRNSYINRKGYHSVLLQGVCDNKKLFIDVYAGEVGSIHDYTLYKRSPLYSAIQNREIVFYENNYLLGDLAYKLDTTLIVGFKDNGHLTQEQKNFNIILSRIRVTIENAFGLLKGRFRRLKFLETIRLDLTSLLIITSCILHNICILNGEIPNELFNIRDEIREELENRPHNIEDLNPEGINSNAIEKKNLIVNRCINIHRND